MLYAIIVSSLDSHRLVVY